MLWNSAIGPYLKKYTKDGRWTRFRRQSKFNEKALQHYCSVTSFQHNPRAHWSMCCISAVPKLPSLQLHLRQTFRWLGHGKFDRWTSTITLFYPYGNTSHTGLMDKCRYAHHSPTTTVKHLKCIERPSCFYGQLSATRCLQLLTDFT